MSTHPWVAGPITFDLAPDHRHLTVRPNSDCSIVIDTAGVAMLLATVKAHTACAVPGRHARYGTWLLGLHPATPRWTDHPADTPLPPCPLELYLLLPDNDIHVRYQDEQVTQLRDTLVEILHLMT